MECCQMTISDWAIVCATLLGPILAVQAQKWIERLRDIRNRKMWVFQTLMATRGARLETDHIRALNMIDLVFYGRRRFGRNRRTETEQAVLDAWKIVLDELGEPWNDAVNNDARIRRRNDLFIDLLVAMGADVRYRFDRVQLKNGAYFPTLHGTIAAEQNELRRLAIQLLKGERAFPVRPTDQPRS
jgi:hypothetical protein